MRIKPEEIDIIRRSVKERDSHARLYLFGSRTDDRAKGGDMDILVFSKNLTFRDKMKIKARIFETLEEQQIHLVIARDTNDPFVRHALSSAVPL